MQESLIFQTQLKSEEFEATGTSIGTENFSNYIVNKLKIWNML
jgi:hypothetical protein